MPDTISTLAVITARGGSKGVLNKNRRELLGKPLIAYTIDAAKRSRHLTRTIVSTDDPAIADIARREGVEVPFMRPDTLAQDDSTSISVVQHALRWLQENENATFDYAMILQPTSPLRTAGDIDACIEKAVETEADSVMSMVLLEDMDIKKLKKIQNDLILPLLEDEGDQSARRSDSEPVYKRNTAIYLTKTDLIMKGKLFGDVSRPYVMPPERSIDINREFDFEIAEHFLQKQS